MRTSEIDIDGPVNVAHFGGSGRPIVLVHGLGSSHVVWTAVGGELAELGDVRAIDLIGFGATPPAGRSSAVTAQRDLVVAYLRTHAAEPAVVVGSSMGGLVAMQVARAAPELVDRLVLVDPAVPGTGPRFDAAVLRRYALPTLPAIGARLAGRDQRRALERPDELVDALLAVLCVDPTRVAPDVREELIAMARRRAGMPWTSDAAAEAAKSIIVACRRRRTFADRVKSIEAPALIVHGARDRLIDLDAARWLARQRPDWRLDVFDDIGHVPQLEAPARFVDAVRGWLAGPGPIAPRGGGNGAAPGAGS